MNLVMNNANASANEREKFIYKKMVRKPADKAVLNEW